MYRWFEARIDPFARAPDAPPPPGLWPFYRHFVRQVWPVVLGVMATGLAAALTEVALFAFLGRVVDLAKAAAEPAAFFAEHSGLLALMLAVALVLRPVAFVAHAALVSLAVAPGLTNLVRWQSHRHVLRQSLAFFQNDFAGRIANQVMQSGPALRESVVQLVDAIWFMVIYTTGALLLFVEADWRLALPLALWVVLYVAALAVLVPRVRARAVALADARSTLTGRVVDSYTNVATVKLFAHAEREDAYAREAFEDHHVKFQAQQRMIVAMQAALNVNNGLLVAGTTGAALALWSWGAVTVGAVALASSLVIRLVNMSGWIMWVVTDLFESIGTVQEGMGTIARPHGVVDREGAPPLRTLRGEVRFERVRFAYDAGGADVVDGLSLVVRPGEKVGLVGRSGAGKSTLVNLLLRFHDLDSGRILIDGQDIAGVAQESLRAKIGVVTQDTSLLHRSIRDNIVYGRPEATEAEVAAAARRAHAHGFVASLADPGGRRGYDAQVGERGVKLSGGQRQRVAIARVLLKDAPILVLDEATSALDSEVEAAIQEGLVELFAGKTVIAIAHRLSTLRAMDRLVVMDRGRIAEEGSHAALVARGGLYADLWARQSGGFLAREAEPAA